MNFKRTNSLLNQLKQALIENNRLQKENEELKKQVERLEKNKGHFLLPNGKIIKVSNITVNKENGGNRS